MRAILVFTFLVFVNARPSEIGLSKKEQTDETTVERLLRLLQEYVQEEKKEVVSSDDPEAHHCVNGAERGGKLGLDVVLASTQYCDTYYGLCHYYLDIRRKNSGPPVLQECMAFREGGFDSYFLDLKGFKLNYEVEVLICLGDIYQGCHPMAPCEKHYVRYGKADPDIVCTVEEGENAVDNVLDNGGKLGGNLKP